MKVDNEYLQIANPVTCSSVLKRLINHRSVSDSQRSLKYIKFHRVWFTEIWRLSSVPFTLKIPKDCILPMILVHKTLNSNSILLDKIHLDLPIIQSALMMIVKRIVALLYRKIVESIVWRSRQRCLWSWGCSQTLLFFS